MLILVVYTPQAVDFLEITVDEVVDFANFFVDFFVDVPVDHPVDTLPQCELLSFFSYIRILTRTTVVAVLTMRVPANM